MARTVDPAAHRRRRDDFIDTARTLIESKGYAAMSVHDVLAQTSTSKGAFYHYFDSKQALLEALIERTAERLTAHLTPVATAERPAVERLGDFFAALAGWKTQRRELLLALTEVWYSDDNALVRQKMRPGLAARITPLLARIIADGTAEGVFTTVRPELAARIVVGLVNDLNDALGELLNAPASEATLSNAEATIAAYTDAIERVLGLPHRSLTVVEPGALAAWFGPPEGE